MNAAVRLAAVGVLWLAPWLSAQAQALWLDAQGQPWWRLALHEPVSENPLLSFELPAQGPQEFRLSGQDNNGNRIAAEVRA